VARKQSVRSVWQAAQQPNLQILYLITTRLCRKIIFWAYSQRYLSEMP